MTDAAINLDEPAADRVEITNAMQNGPARWTGQFGTRLDYSNAGGMLFLVDIIDVGGNREAAAAEASYERAIVEAEELALDLEVAVHDLVTPDVPDAR